MVKSIIQLICHVYDLPWQLDGLFELFEHLDVSTICYMVGGGGFCPKAMSASNAKIEIHYSVV